MDTLNSNPAETGSVPEAAPVMTDAVIVNATPAAATTPAPIPAAAPAPAPVPVVKGELPKTTGNTPGGWNRFAGYDRNAAKNKANDRGSKGRR